MQLLKFVAHERFGMPKPAVITLAPGTAGSTAPDRAVQQPFTVEAWIPHRMTARTLTADGSCRWTGK